MRHAALLASCGLCSSVDEALKLSRRRRLALVFIAQEMEAERAARIADHIGRGLAKGMGA